MKLSGISDKGFKRLAKAVKGQEREGSYSEGGSNLFNHISEYSGDMISYLEDLDLNGSDDQVVWIGIVRDDSMDFSAMIGNDERDAINKAEKVFVERLMYDWDEVDEDDEDYEEERESYEDNIEFEGYNAFQVPIGEIKQILAEY